LIFEIARAYELAASGIDYGHVVLTMAKLLT
jgi:hypothetical protein